MKVLMVGEGMVAFVVVELEDLIVSTFDNETRL